MRFAANMTLVRDYDYQEVWSVLIKWPSQMPLCGLLDSENTSILAVHFSQVKFKQFSQKKLENLLGSVNSSAGNYIGFVSYDQYANDYRRSVESRVYKIEQALVFDHKKRTLKLFKLEDESSVSSDQLDLVQTWQLGANLGKVLAKQMGHHEYSSLELIPKNSNEDYLAQCRRAIDYIKEGRFYQINLLRYFSVRGTVSRKNLVARLKTHSGPFGALFDFEDYILCSFSPERFVALTQTLDSIKALCSPIKGTRPRFLDRKLDQKSKESLKNSDKDWSELNMITDLMRNDLNAISQRQSVVVSSSGEVQTFQTVFHLMSEICSTIRPNLSLDEFFSFLCPAGSITGAPKIEVMRAINEFEGRPRGVFMGNVFYSSRAGCFDSSVLIRTLYGKKTAISCYDAGRFEYAAGSGVVLSSSPKEELSEIFHKCSVIYDAVNKLGSATESSEVKKLDKMS